MNCVNCGNELFENEKFCKKCGTPVAVATANNLSDGDSETVLLTEEQVNNTSYNNKNDATTDSIPVAQLKEKGKKAKKKKGKGGLIVLLIFILIIAGGCAGAFWWLNRPINKVQSALNEGDINKVLEVYDSVDNDEDAQELKNEALDYANQKYDDYFNEVEGSDYATTKSALEKLGTSILSGNAELADLLVNLDRIQNSRNAYESAEKLNAQGMYAQAIEQYNLVDSADTIYYDLAQTALIETINTYRTSVLDSAAALQEAGNLAEAAKTLEEGLNVLSNDSSLTSELKLVESLLQNNEVAAAVASIEDATSDGDFAVAFAALKKIEKDYGTDASVISAKENLIKNYKEDCQTQLEEFLASRSINEALSLINEMKGYLPDDDEIDDLYAEYEGYKPVKLVDYTIFDSNHVSLVSNLSDTYDNNYSMSVEFSGWSNSNTFVKYLINNKFNSFSGTLSYENTDSSGKKNGKMYIEIYADDELLFTSGEISNATAPISFDLDLGEECHELRILGKSSVSKDYVVLLSNGELYSK